MSLLQLVRGESSTGMPTREADINHVVSSHSWVHWHSRPRWLRLLPSIPQLEVSCKTHKTAAHLLSDNAHRSIPLGCLPFANVKTSRSIVVHRLDLCRRADSPHRISCLCCWSSNGGHDKSQPSWLCGPAMARHAVLLVYTCIRAGAKCLGLAHLAPCQHCGGGLARSGFRCDHHYSGSNDRRETYRNICLHRGLQHEWVAVGWDLVVGRTPVDRLPVPWVSSSLKLFPTLKITMTDKE